MSVCLSHCRLLIVSMSVCLTILLTVYLSVYLSLCLSVCLSVCLTGSPVFRCLTGRLAFEFHPNGSVVLGTSLSFIHSLRHEGRAGKAHTFWVSVVTPPLHSIICSSSFWVHLNSVDVPGGRRRRVYYFIQHDVMYLCVNKDPEVISLGSC